MKPARETSDRRGGRAAATLMLVVLAIVVIAAGLGGYVVSRAYPQPTSKVYGDGAAEPDRVDVMAWVTRVDVVSQKVAVTITDIEPSGSYATPDGRFAVDVELEANSLKNFSTAIGAEEMLPNIEQEFALSGVVTDFPFDRYTATMGLRMVDSNGEEVPIAVTVYSSDAFFVASPRWDLAVVGWLNLDLSVERSYPTIVFGIFIMTLMLGLAVAAAVLAYYLIRFRQGMQYSAYSVMAGLLFAMVPLRNAVPGNPPIGSVIDFMSFFIAEAVISVSLIASVVYSYLHQRAVDEKAAAK
ncbi:MAG: DUF4436 family protein [Mycobacterium sp.]